MDVMGLLYILSPLFAASDDSGEAAAAIPLLLLLSGFIFYGYIYSKYRNTDKRHSHETETMSNIANLGALDNLVEHRTRLKNSKMTGANHDRIEGALNPSASKSAASAAMDLAKKLTGS